MKVTSCLTVDDPEPSSVDALECHEVQHLPCTFLRGVWSPVARSYDSEGRGTGLLLQHRVSVKVNSYPISDSSDRYSLLDKKKRGSFLNPHC